MSTDQKKAPIRLRLVHGSFVGPGCPDRYARTKTPGHAGVDCRGHLYDGDHPAQVGEIVLVEDSAQADIMVQGGCFERA